MKILKNNKKFKIVIGNIALMILLIIGIYSIFSVTSFADFKNVATSSGGFFNEKEPMLHHLGSYYVMRDDEQDDNHMSKVAEANLILTYLNSECHCNDYYGFVHINHRGCSLREGWENVKYSRCPHYQSWDYLFSMASLWGSSNTESFSKSYVVNALSNWINANLGEKWTISQIMEFLNNTYSDIGGGTSSGYWLLQNHASVFCLKHGQAIGTYHGYVMLDHPEGLGPDVSKHISVNYDSMSASFSSTIPASDLLDYFDDDQNEAGTIRTVKSNVKYFVTNLLNTYTINNGFGTYSTNIFNYSTAYTEKNHMQGLTYKEERAQLGIWAVVGNPGRGVPITGYNENHNVIDESENEGDETTTSTDLIVNSELYMCGAALDEYEEILTSNIGGSADTKHQAALTGTDTKLKNQPIVKINANSNSDNLTGNQIGTTIDSVGTTLQEENGTYYYKIGPFQMNDYALAFAKNDIKIFRYSGAGLATKQQMLGGITEGKITFTDDSGNNVVATLNIGNDTEKQAKVVYTDMRGNAVSNKGINRSGNYTYTPSTSEYEFPLPDSEFYIYVKKDLCNGAANLGKMSFTYRQTKADGHGWVITSKYVQTQWKRESEGAGCTTYTANCSSGGTATSSIGGYHSMSAHSHPGCACGGYTPVDEDGNGGDPICDGDHTCSATHYCTHKHTDCEETHWKNTSIKVVQGQPFLAVHDSKVEVVDKEWTSDLNIRMTTDVTINKYIYDVEHVVSPTPNPNSETLKRSGYDSTLSSGNGRATLGEDTKGNSPVYVEYGDIVTYHIDIKNDQAQTIELKLRDIYPDNSKLISVKNLATGITYTVSKSPATSASNPVKVIKENEHYFTTDWVSAPKGTTTLEVKVKVMRWEDDNIWENKASIITRNAGYLGDVSKNVVSIDYMRTDITERPGPVVNLAELDPNKKKDSSDFYKLNNYNAFIDKYLYTYDESVRLDNVNNLKLSNETTLVENKNGVNNVLKSYQADTSLAARERLSDSTKKNAPVPVEKDEIITYQIKVTNEATEVASSVAGANKPATQVRTDKITDLMEIGLQFIKVEAKQYNADGSPCGKYYTAGNVPVTTTSKGTTTANGRTYNKYEYDITTSTILDPGEYIIYTVTVKITESDLYLYDLDNSADLTILSNINHEDSKDKDGETEREIKNDKRDENISNQEISHEYVRMKDLIIGGKVWLDFNKNGLMDDTITDYVAQTKDESLYRSDPSKLSTYHNINENAMMKDIVVKLYTSDGKLVRTTRTDGDGIFSFARGEDGVTYYETQYYNLDQSRVYSSNKKYERIDKATGKDENGNYTANSQYIEYYIEYEYDGVVYKATAYSGKDHLNTDGSYKGAACNHSFETNLTDNSGKNRYETDNYTSELSTTSKYKYEYDSNANEFVNVRETFNTDYEYITYNQAYSTKGEMKAGSDLDFDKTDHTSQLLVDHNRKMTARSFIEEIAQPNTQEATNYIPLFGYNNSNVTVPYSRYLKFINLGLELRDDVDISLTKDVYKVKTTIKGEEMEYNFNTNTIINGDVLAEGTDNYKLDKPYGIELYESDYKYRREQYRYKTEENIEGLEKGIVEDYLGDESELNVEVTYRIRIDNNEVHKDDDLKDLGQLSNGYEDKNFQDTNESDLYVRISEILDLYDENFIEYTQEMENGGKDDFIKARTIDPETGRFSGTDKQIKIAEAWYYKEAENGKYILKDGLYIDTTKEYITTEYEGPRYEAISLKVSNSAIKGSTNEYINSGKYKPNNDNETNAEGYDGYHKLYISGMENEKILEGEHLDIFVKYVVEKDKEEEVTIDKENLQETATKTSEVLYGISVSYDETTGEYSWSWSSSGATIPETTVTTNMIRSLVIKEHTTTPEKQAYGLATENIAQINLYSVWYKDSDKETSIVDRDSNAGNVGMKDTINKVIDSADNMKLYEDTVYKAGIDISAEGTANVPDPTTWRIDGGGTTEILRFINGHVWDDSRSENATTPEDSTTPKEPLQYIGNGLRNSGEAIEEAKKNELVPIVKGKDVTEKNDIPVSSAKAEFVEIVETAKDTYYEIIPTNISSDYKQHTRTNEKGEYTLFGYTPGKYVVRFTYGDNIDKNVADGINETSSSGQASQEDMYLFNGQDYKSTKYTTPDSSTNSGVLSDDIVLYNNENKTTKEEILKSNQDKIDKIIASLEEKDYNDARDDEVRRLEVNSYSEIMDNMIAEILQGMANGTVIGTETGTETGTEAGTEAEAGTGTEAEEGTEIGTGIETGTVAGIEKTETLTNNGHINSEVELDALVDNTWMFAETIPFTVRAEKIDKDKIDKFKDEEKAKLLNATYGNREELEKELVNIRTFTISNVDFGIEYRPENAVQLEKDIKEVKITTESGETVVDLHFYTEYQELNKDSETVKTHYIDTDKSVGLDMIQFISNDYSVNDLVSKLISEKDGLQGFVYINYDTDIQQGATVEITYEYIAENHGEVDRIAKNLDDIRYQDNYAVITNKDISENVERNDVNDDVNKNGVTNYRANITAANDMIDSIYRKDSNENTYRVSPKILTSTNNDERITNNANGAPGNVSRNKVSYYGYYEGYTYYTGKVTDFDTVAELKINKILDYVDKDMVYLDSTTGEDTLNKHWSALNNIYGEYYSIIDWARSDTDYISTVTGNNIGKDRIENFINQGIEALKVTSMYEEKDQNAGNTTETQTIDAEVSKIKDASIDPDGYVYNSMLLSTDTGIYTDKYINESRDLSGSTPGTNPSVSRFLIPMVADSDTDEYNGSRGRIQLTVSKAISAETGDDELEYENIGEIVEYSTLTGRRTNFATTIGNVDLRMKDADKGEYPESVPEPDQSSTEVVTLVPPQGLMKRDRVIKEVIEIAKTGTQVVVIIVAVVAIVGFVTMFSIRKYQKRRIK